MARNSDTKKFTTSKSAEGRNHPAQQKPAKKHSAKQIVLAVTVAVLVALVLTAVVFVIRDLALQERNPAGPSPAESGSSRSTEPVNTVPANPENDPSKHPAAHAIDGNDSTYMISEQNQRTGAFLLLELGEETDVMNVEIRINNPAYYIRKALIDTSADNVKWEPFAEFSYQEKDAGLKTLSKGVAQKAKYVKITLADNADTQWMINTVRVLSQDDTAVGILRAELGFTGGSVVTGEVTTAQSVVPGGYQTKIVQNSELYTGDLIVVNAKHQYLFPASTANILPLYDSKPTATLPNGSKVSAYNVGGSQVPALQAGALKAFNALAVALAEETGIAELEIGMNDAWRSRETQADLYNKYPTTASQAGYSEHNTGLCLNICLMTDKGTYKLSESAVHPACATVYNWLTANAHKFGFVERFPAAKKAQTGVTDDYHYRYVGYPHAYYMKQNNLCLEEYAEALRAYTFGGNHLTFTGDDGNTYEIYTVPMDKSAASTEIPVPSDSPYTVSGDNYGSFIVTVTK